MNCSAPAVYSVLSLPKWHKKHSKLKSLHFCKYLWQFIYYTFWQVILDLLFGLAEAKQHILLNTVFNFKGNYFWLFIEDFNHKNFYRKN